MAFIQQLKLLLWKNWLIVIRQPIWSLTLVTWPLILFIIIAVTRVHFPPVRYDACYVKPRNLPSTGFFPFLQTLLCNTDSTCHDQPRLVDPGVPKSSQGNQRANPLLADLIQGDFPIVVPKDNNDPAALLELLNNMFGQPHPGHSHRGSSMNTTSITSLGDKETMKKTLESMNLLKRAICTMTLPMINATSPDPVSSALRSFCKSNSTAFEVALGTLNEILTELMVTNPEELAKLAGAGVLVLDQLQSETSLWETLLAIPRVLSSGSFYEMMSSAETLLSNMYRTSSVIQSHFAELGGLLSSVRSSLGGAINVFHYAQNWPGRDVWISLRDVVTLPEGMSADLVKDVLDVQISLDTAMVLALDREAAHQYLCQSGNNANQCEELSSSGHIRQVLDWVSPALVAKKTFIAWSKHAAVSDMSFAKGLLSSLMGNESHGGYERSNTARPRARRYVDTQNENIELLFGVSQVAMEIIKPVPDAEMVVQTILRVVFEYMKTATLTLETAEELVESALKDVDQLHQTYLMLLTNRSEANVWITRVAESLGEVIMKSLSPENRTCEDKLSSFEWLLNTDSVNVSFWRAVICQDASFLQTMVIDIEEFFVKPLQTDNDNVTLPMIVAEWTKLYNSTLRFGAFVARVATQLGVSYRMNWMPNSTDDITGALGQSFYVLMVKFGESFEKSQRWPEMRSYFHMAFWIFNYRPGHTTQPPNCTLTSTLQILCNTGFNWPQFSQAVIQALVSPNQDVLLNCLKGSVNLLQHTYGGLLKSLAGSHLRQSSADDTHSAFLIHLMNNLEDFVHNISALPDQQSSDPNVMVPLVGHLFHSAGLSPLLPLLFGGHPINVSTVLDVACKIGRLNQHLLTFNVTDPSAAELERLMMQLFSLEGNLTMSLSHIMGHTLLTYSHYFPPDAVARLRKALQPFANQTTAGYVEAILNAMELLKTGIDSSNGDPTRMILAYIRQLQEFVKSLFGLRRIQQNTLPSGELSTAQVTYLRGIYQDFLDLLSPESLQNLTQAGPDAAQNIVIQRFLALLPPEVQEKAKGFLQDFKALQHHLARCAGGADCLANVSEIFTFLDQILDMTLSANGSVTIKMAAKNSELGGQGHEEIASLFFSLLLPSNDASSVETFRRTLYFIRLIMATPNITVSDVQNALRESNLTLTELNYIASLAGKANMSDLMVNIMEIFNAQQCFESQPDPTMCALEVIKGVSGFLTHVPALQNETAIISIISQVIRNTTIHAIHGDLPLSNILANVKMSLQRSNLLTPEIKNEIKVLDDLIKLALRPLPSNNFNISMMDPTEVEILYLEMIDWYLKRVINITSNSSFSELLQPFFSLTQMEVTLQLAQANFTLFVSNQVEFLINNLQYPIDGAGLKTIGLTAVEILRREVDLIFLNLALQNDTIPGSIPEFHAIPLNGAQFQVEHYLNLIEMWMKQPNVPPVLTSMLRWGNASMNISDPLTDFQHLLGTMVYFLSDDQLANLHMIGNVTESLRRALMVAEQPGGLQSDQFIVAIVEAVQIPMQIALNGTAPLPLFVQQDILDVVRYSLKLILQTNMSYASSRNLSLVILKKAERIVHMVVPEQIAQYLLPSLKAATSYVENIRANGPDWLNQLVLSQLRTIQSFLPRNSSAQTYFSIFINITEIIFMGPGNTLGGYWGEYFDKLSDILYELIMETADQDTWDALEKNLRALLSTFQQTELWDSVSSVVTLYEKILDSVVKINQAENELYRSLQVPVVTLMREIAQSANTSHFNLSDISEQMHHVIEITAHAALQAHGTLNCSEVLTLWEPVSEAVGLNRSTMAMWCNINLHPLLEAYREAIRVHSNLNMTHMDVGPMTVNATAARIVNIGQTLYQSNINSSLAMQQLIMTFSDQFNMLTGQPLSTEAQLRLYKMLQYMMLQSSLDYLKLLSDNLTNLPPSLRPFIHALEKSVRHIMNNNHLTEDPSFFMVVVREAAEIFLVNAFHLSMDNDPDSVVTGIIRQVVKVMIDTRIFGNEPMAYNALERFLESNDSSLIARNFIEIFSFFAQTQASGLDLPTLLLPKVYNILRPLLSLLIRMNMDIPAPLQVFEDLAENTGAMLRQLVDTGGLLPPMKTHGLSMYQNETTGGDHPMKRRYRRHSPWLPPSLPMDDFIDLFYIDYHAMFRALAVPPTTDEIMETAHLFVANPNLNVVLKGVMGDTQWGLNASQGDTIDAALGVASFFTLPAVTQLSSMHLLRNAVDLIPDGFPFSMQLQNITRALARESPENLILMQRTIRTAVDLLQVNPKDDRFTETLGLLKFQVCELLELESVHQMLKALSIVPGRLCHVYLPSLEILVESLKMNTTSLTDAIFQTIFGDPLTYNVPSNWTSVLTQRLGFQKSKLKFGKINITSLDTITVGEMLRNETAFILDVQQHMDFDPAALHLLLGTTLPNSNLEILSWLLNLRQCDSVASLETTATDVAILQTFCSLSAEQWYTVSVLMTRHVKVEKVIYRMVLSEEVQSLVQVMLQVAETITKMTDTFVPTINKLQNYLISISELDQGIDNRLKETARRPRSTHPSGVTFVTLSRALCSNGILALFGVSKLKVMSAASPAFPDTQQREEMIERFKIPRTATPFCMNMYLDMVNTTGGAIAWAFLKPMLMGHILFTPDTPVTRAIMRKANATLQEFANLRKNSQDWLETSNYVLDSAQLLSQTLPILQSSLGNSFVKSFIEMQTDIDVDKMREMLGNFSNVTGLLENNRPLMDQITALSTLMVQLSSCIKFDRYRGYDSAEELDAVAQDLAANRDLYASVIFKLPKDEDSSGNIKAKSPSSTSSLPPKVSYTIRMHMDNVMRTDRVRNPYFTKNGHISAQVTLRYNRGFIYLQESIDRAIIETQTGQSVTEPGVQLQPFPYPCHIRDEYLEGISFVFPLVLMLAWVLFVAHFVKKLVHERELRLHEYMKMMGVNPLSHFFAWFLECTTFLVLTIFMLTLVLKHGGILPKSDGFLVFLYLCDYGLSIVAFSYLISSFFDKTYIAGLSGSLIYILCFFPYIVVMAKETGLTFSQKSVLSLFSPTCYSYACQYVSRYEAQGEGIQWSNSYSSPISGDTASFGWLCWLMLIDSTLYFFIGAYVRMVFPGNYGIPAPWYFPFKASFWADLCCVKSKRQTGRGLLFTNIMQKNHPAFIDDKGKGQGTLSPQTAEDFSELPVGVALRGLSKIYGDRLAIENLNFSFYEGHITSLLGHNGAGKTTTMSLLTGLFTPSAGSIEVYGRDMGRNIDDIRKDLGVCMQYDVLFDHMTTKEHLLLYGRIKAPHWSHRELREQVRTILEETGMYAHRHKRVGTLSGGMKRKLSISIAFIGGSRLVVLDEPTTGVDPCSRRSIWDVVLQHKKNCTIIMSTHHLDEAEVLSDRIALLERGELKCCGSPFHLKDKLGQGYKLTLTKKTKNLESEEVDGAELKSFIQAHVPEARLKDDHGGDLVYSLPPFSSASASSYRSLLTALDSNLDALQLGGYGISDTTLEEAFLQLTKGGAHVYDKAGLPSISKAVSDTESIASFSSDFSGSGSSFSDKIKLTSSSTVRGLALAWQQMTAILIKRFHHSRRDWKGLISQLLLPVLFVVVAMGLGSIRSDIRHFRELELSPALYNFSPSYTFFSNQNPNSSQLADTMISFPGIDNACLDKSDDLVCTTRTNKWTYSWNSSKAFSACKCTSKEQVCDGGNFQPPRKRIPSSHIVYNLSGIDVENYLAATANSFIRNRYGGFSFGMPLPADFQMDISPLPKNRTLSKVWFNPEGHHTMPAYLNSINNLILRSNLPANKDPHEYAISVSSHPYFGRVDDEDAIIQGMLHILVALCVLIGYSITTASFAMYEVNEHHSGSKRLQHIAGISEPLYWAVNFFYDMAMYLIPVTMTVAVIAAFQVPAFTDRQNLAAITLLLVLFGFATFPWMYLLSGVFKDAEMAFITYVCINLFLSVNTILPTSILYFMGQIASRPELIKDIFDKLCQAFLIFPQFNCGNGLMWLVRKNIEVQILSGYSIDAYQSPFSLDALGWMFISSLIQGTVFITLRLLLNKFLIRKVRHLIFGRNVQPVDWEDEDEDVSAERLRVCSGAASSDILQVNQLTKVYQHLKKKTYAVKRLSVGIPAGECFGLLGENGAGKTTTFKMLTGDVSPTEGTARIREWDGRLVDIMECRAKGINIGYCPQEDALDNLLTGEEHLYFYGRIQGISKTELDGVVEYLLRRLELSYHKNIVTDGYSCGTRRKLSTAMALIGHPQILLLDEPSSGMDPQTKRHLWKIISEEVKGKCAVVLTSHSMEECEALCSRLAIMVKGEFRCLGSLQHIKNRFGSGFTVKMYLTSCDTDTITNFMRHRFPSTYLKDQHSAMLEYHVPVAPGGVADIFTQLESNKNALHIKHFSVSQTTLDEVFINFAMGNLDMDSKSIHSDDESDGQGSNKAVEAAS